MTGWRKGVLAALVGVGVVEGTAALLRSRSFLDAAGQVVVDSGPIPLVERTVQLLRTADKPVVRAAAGATLMAGGGLLGQLRRRPARDAVAVAAAAAAGVAAAQRRASSAAGTVQPRWHATAGAGAGAVATMAVLRGAPAAAAGAVGAASLVVAAQTQARRRIDQDAAFGKALAPTPVGRALRPAVDGAETWPGAVPLLTPVEEFYVTDVNMRPPLVDVARWRLAVHGRVASPLSLSYAQLLELGPVEFDAAMVCIHNRLGWSRVGNARWTGVPLRRILEAARPDGDAAVLVSRAVDGWECSFPLGLLDQLDGYVVVGMGGQALTAAHGFPARLFVPGLYGQYSGAKWLSGLRLQAAPNRDYWLPRGWPHGPARVRSLSRIDAPRHRAVVTAGLVDIVGVAWAPPVGVHGVDVAVNGSSWRSAELARELSPAAWRRWRAQLELPPGRHRIRVRCVAADGTVQEAEPRPPFPSGASGHHTVVVMAR